MIQRTISLGPIHPWLPGAMKLKLDLYGDQIVSAEPSFGYAGKQIETKVKELSYENASFLVSRVEPESAFLLDRMYFESVEKALGVVVEDRAVWIRNVTTLMSELNGGLKYLAQMADVLGLRILRHIILKHREELLDLVELFSGSRYGYYYLVAGGTRYDLTEGFVERMEAWVKEFRNDYPRIESMFLWTHRVQNRLRSLGRVMDNGNFAFVTESAVENTRYGLVSQVESRLLYAMKEVSDLSEELVELVNESQNGKHRVPVDSAPRLKQNSVDSEIATLRGRWGMNISLTSDQKIQSLSVEAPSLQIQAAIPLALEGEQYEDIPVILQSLNFHVTEIDR